MTIDKKNPIQDAINEFCSMVSFEPTKEVFEMLGVYMSGYADGYDAGIQAAQQAGEEECDKVSVKALREKLEAVQNE